MDGSTAESREDKSSALSLCVDRPATASSPDPANNEGGGLRWEKSSACFAPTFNLNAENCLALTRGYYNSLHESQPKCACAWLH